MYDYSKDNSWRSFQTDFISQKKKKTRFSGLIKSMLSLLTASLLFAGILLVNIGAPVKEVKTLILPPESDEDPAQPPASSRSPELSRQQLNEMLSQIDVVHTDKNRFNLYTPENHYKITTSIDSDLQSYLLSLMDRARELTRGKHQKAAFVVMEPETGKIIAMTGYDLDQPDVNPCLESDYPAASIFKIVTAAAAVETLGYSPHTQLYFNGNKYTLYKQQVQENRNKHSYEISFSSAFAQSVNPVFGRIGKNYLGKEKLESYATAFGFNELIQAELPFVSGNFETNNNEFHLAELGSGFNRDTTISPIFGAMLVSAVVNKGRAMMPTLVEEISDASGNVVYQSEASTYKSAITPKTAETMMQIMEKTITTGTARKSFQGCTRDPILSRLIMGGKTGSLSNREHTVKYDWFTGFGKEKNGNRKIVVAIVIGHAKYIGTKSSVYANMIFKQYFKNNADTTAQL